MNLHYNLITPELERVCVSADFWISEGKGASGLFSGNVRELTARILGKRLCMYACTCCRTAIGVYTAGLIIY